jgi:hypothetical protein
LACFVAARNRLGDASGSSPRCVLDDPPIGPTVGRRQPSRPGALHMREPNTDPYVTVTGVDFDRGRSAMIETLGCGHQIAWDIAAGYYRLATRRRCAACAGRVRGPLDTRTYFPRG